jgi:hypothetical protein
MTINKDKVDIPIDKLTEDELSVLNRRIVERLKFLESQHTHREMMQFSVGENVCFVPPGKERQMGVLVKYNKKTVTIITEGGRRWNVSPHLLSREPMTINATDDMTWQGQAANGRANNVVALKARQ